VKQLGIKNYSNLLGGLQIKTIKTAGSERLKDVANQTINTSCSESEGSGKPKQLTPHVQRVKEVATKSN